MPYIPAAIHLTGGIIIQLIKEPGIEKCYSTLAERVGGIDFHAGTLFDQEGYKYHIFREGHEIMMNPEGGYFDRGGKALEIVPEGLQGRQNLVDWHDVSDYWDMRRSLPDAPSSGKGWLCFGASQMVVGFRGTPSVWPDGQ